MENCYNAVNDILYAQENILLKYIVLFEFKIANAFFMYT